MLKRSRIVIMVVLVFGILCCYILQLMQYQVTDGEAARQQGTKSTINKMTIIARRGDILDRYGRVLATSSVGYNVVIESAYFPSNTQKAKQDSELLELCDLFKKAGETWVDTLPITTGTPYAYTFTGNAKEQQKQLAALIKTVNGLSSKKAQLANNAKAGDVMNALKRIFKTSGHPEAEQRTLCGIRYTMVVQAFSYSKVFTLAKGVSLDTITKIEENSATLPGAVTQQVPQRCYPDGSIAPHVIGLTGPIFAEQWQKYKAAGYSADDIIGKFGVEKSMEQYLHGVNGVQQVEQNSNGDVTSSSIVTQPKPGDNVILTIDEDLQTTLQNALPTVVNQIRSAAGGDERYGADVQGAAAVVEDIKNGEVLAMATYPSYNLNDYKTSYSSLASNKLTPLLNRCIAGTYRPGSTFKPITSTAGLMGGDITPTSTIYCPAQFTKYQPSYVGSDDDNYAWGDINVADALSVSSNVFFNTLGDHIGMRRLENTARGIFGIGKKTGIELGDESPGIMSGYTYADQHDLPVHPADPAQAAIGQLYTKLTPLQLTNYVSILMNNGKQDQVHIVKQINSYDNKKVIVNNNDPKVVSDTKIAAEYVDAIKSGMLKVTESDSGTAAVMFKNFNMKVGGKTGTAQIGELKSPNVRFNGVFVCFAPYDNPEIAISVVVEHGHFGNQTTDAAKSALQNYFTLDQNGNPIQSTCSTTSTGTLLQ